MYENQVIGMTDYEPDTERGYIASDADAAFIAASRTDIPALLAHIAAVEAELEGMHKALRAEIKERDDLRAERDALAAKIAAVTAQAATTECSWEANHELGLLAWANRDRILEALRRDEDPRRALADRLLAICENPDAFSVGHDPRDPALSQLRRACAALLALAKGTAP
jgi:hypothetical protein